jgi:hypothetical protein
VKKLLLAFILTMLAGSLWVAALVEEVKILAGPSP